MIIRQNIEKAWYILKMVMPESGAEYLLPETVEILKKQLLKIEMEKALSVLCTCAFYIVDYNPKFITD